MTGRAIAGRTGAATSLAKVPGSPILLVALANGRLFLYDENTLSPLRTAQDFVPSGSPNLARPSNDSLARNCTADFERTNTNTLRMNIADFEQPFLEPPVDPLDPHQYRIESLELDLSAAPSLTRVPDIGQYALPASLFKRDARDTRTFRLTDLDGDSFPEVYTLAGSGAVYMDDMDVIRSFSNVTVDLDLLPFRMLINGGMGGFVFEQLQPYVGKNLDADSRVLDGFVVPQEPQEPQYYQGSDPALWWAARTGLSQGGSVFSGQIAQGFQGVFPWASGSSSMIVAKLWNSAGTALETQIVTGTTGGYVYVVAPTTPNSNPSVLTELAELTHASSDLGWSVVGMDAGNLDQDPEDEIVVGVWMDAGGHDDWAAGDTTRNRGKVYVLDPDPSSTSIPRGFTITELLGDISGPLSGIGSGVFGVRIDDIDGDMASSADGRFNELWAGDAGGRLYVFRRDVSGTWQTAYQSADLYPYMGYWNGLWPIKENVDGTGETVGLVVRSTGYWSAFQVDYRDLGW